MNQPLPRAHSAERARTLEVGPEQAGQRLDNFLVRELKRVPKGHIYRIVRTGQVRVNSRRIRPDYRLEVGDQVRIPPLRLPEAAPPARPGTRVLDRVGDAIVYEDGGVIVLDKPSGLAVHGGSGVSYGVIEALRALRPNARFLELVHRLDRDTSGCLMIAKKRSVLRGLHEALRQGSVDKRYLALVKGRWEGGKKRICAALRKQTLRGGERMVAVDRAGKEAVSLFRPVTVRAVASLVEVDLTTGRTHQIRVHSAHIGHPIAGDEKYGDAQFNGRMRELGLRRLFLHAHSLSFVGPHTGQEIHVSTPLPDDLRQVLNQLERLHER